MNTLHFARQAARQRGGFRGPHRGFKGQRGGFAVGLIIGLLLGLALALGVALYVTKVPVPFVNKVPQRNPSQDAAEAEKNKNWDPNSPLYGKNPARPSSAASDATAAAPATSVATPVIPGMPSTTPPGANLPGNSAAVPAARASMPANARDPAAILAGQAPTRAASGAAPMATVPTGPSTTTGADPFTYFVQAGAYGRTEDAEAQRAKIALLGMDAKLTEREQSGRTVFRVRVGPFDKRADADAAKSALDSAGVEAALVRVQRSGSP